MSSKQIAPFAAPLAIALIALAGCATKPKPPVAAAPPPAVAHSPAPQPYAPPPAPSGPLAGSEQDFVVNIGDRVYFDYDQYAVRPDAEPVLARQAAWLARYPQVAIRIEGNADERGTREYNYALGGRRAEAVRRFLIARGVAAARIATISYGKERPIDLGHDEAAWAKNRNGHTALVSGTR